MHRATRLSYNKNKRCIVPLEYLTTNNRKINAIVDREAAPVRLGELAERLGGGRLQLLAADLGEHVAELVVRLGHRVVRAQVLAHAVHEALVETRGALELLQPSHHTVCTHAIRRFNAI